jgi:hypothetical protein
MTANRAILVTEDDWLRLLARVDELLARTAGARGAAGAQGVGSMGALAATIGALGGSGGAGGAAGMGGLAMFEVTGERADTVTARPTSFVGGASEPTGSAEIDVAKPWLLQRTPFDGETIDYPGAGGQSITYTYTNDFTRTANDGTDSITELVTPRYHEGELIVAVRIPVTSVGGSEGDEAVAWMDLNTGARAWAKEPEVGA